MLIASCRLWMRPPPKFSAIPNGRCTPLGRASNPAPPDAIDIMVVGRSVRLWPATLGRMALLGTDKWTKTTNERVVVRRSDHKSPLIVGL